MHQDDRIVAGHFEGSPGEIDALPTVRRRIVAPVVKQLPNTAGRRPGERRAVIWVARDRLLEQTQRLGDLLC
jgi:hypothetical protein